MFDVTDWIRVAFWFFLQIHPFLYELKICYRRKCDCCVEKKIITWICENHFWHLRRFVTQNHARTKKIVVYMYIFVRSYTQRVIAIHQTFTECLICFFKITIWYIFIFPLISQVKERWWHFWSLFLWRHSLINVVESSQPDSRVLTLDLITAVCFRLGWRNKRLGKWDSQIQVTGW